MAFICGEQKVQREWSVKITLTLISSFEFFVHNFNVTAVIFSYINKYFLLLSKWISYINVYHINV